MFKMATLLLQGGQTFKMATFQVCQRMATLNAQNPYPFKVVKVATLTTLKSAVTAIRVARAATCVTPTIRIVRKKASHEGLEGLRASHR
jgi:hypothetical protein